MIVLALLLASSSDPWGEASALYDRLARGKAGDEGYERTEYELASALSSLELNVAAAEYFYNVARNRTQPELLAGALESLRAIMRGPHDEQLIEKSLLAESELGRFPSELDAFVSYTKGLEDLRAHRLEWAERHFAAIDISTAQHPEALYALGVQRLRRGAHANGVKLLRQALAHPSADRALKNEALLALARILFEDRRYDAALDLYQRVEHDASSPADATLYLELAWTFYQLGNVEAAMGALHTLDAPLYREYHAPEVFVLRASIYKSLCHYVPAKRVIRAFRRRYEESLTNVRVRADLFEDPVLRGAALQRGQLKRLAAFQKAIAAETSRVQELGDGALATHLFAIYAVKQRQVESNINAVIDDQVREVAEELIDLEEQMQLLDYELGLAIHQRARVPLERRDRNADDSRDARFIFGGEYWNDELDDYRLVLEDRCVRTEDP